MTVIKNNAIHIHGRFFAALILPVIPIAASLMVYNYARFGSVFDFGAQYNLTTNDMTHRGWKWDRLLLGLYTFLFEPTSIKAVFPFVYPSEIKTLFMGTTISENNFGGIFFCFPILFLSCFPFFVKRYVAKSLKGMLFFFLLSAMVIIVVDTQVAGLVGSRYRMDFGWLLCLSMVLTVGSMLKRITVQHERFVCMLLKYSFAGALLYSVCLYFALARSAEFFRAMIQFWV